MSYARSPRPVCSTTIGTRPIPIPPWRTLTRRRNDQRRVRYGLFANLRGLDHPLQRPSLQQGLLEALSPLRRLVVRPHPRGLPRFGLHHPVDLLCHVLVAHRQVLLARDRREDDLPLERPLDPGTIPLFQLGPKRVVDRPL